MSFFPPLTVEAAGPEEAVALADLHMAVADRLKARHGDGPWSARTSEKGILFAMRTSRVFVVREGEEMVGTFRLSTRKPWAIDTTYFSECRWPLYLTGMAVIPCRQRQGIGRWCLEEATRIARSWPADAIRLDAYDAVAGAGGFYERCGWVEKGRTTYRGAPLIYYQHILERDGAGGMSGVTVEPRRAQETDERLT